MKIEKNEAFWTNVEEGNFLHTFVDKDHQNWNFMVTKAVVSMILYH